MKIFLLLAFILFFYSSISQPKITMTVNGKHDDILGYTMDPDGSGNKQSISLFGPMQNLTSELQFAYAAGTPIPTITLSMTGPTTADNVLITISNATVYAIKQYLSNYTNGSFIVSSSGQMNAEIKCRFDKIVTQQGGSQKVPMTDPGNLAMDNMTTQKWEVRTDPNVTGVGGKVSLQLPEGTNYHTHLEFFDAADTKNRVASWFGNNENDLLPGQYNVMVDGKYTIRNVPVEKGKTTRLKMGVFTVGNYGGVQIENSDHEKFSYSGPFSILLPEGTYYINGKKDHQVLIKDGTVTKL